MESINFINDFESLETNNNLDNEALIGWSATCLDQTISYYLECNCNEINHIESLEN
jgi:hypothetical protein